MTYTLYPSEKPKAIEVIHNSRKKGEGVITDQGIYELKGDDLKIVLRTGGNERPKEFEAKDSNTTLTVLKRLRIGAATIERPSAVNLARGTRAVAFKLSKDQKIPDGVVPGRAVDVIAEISEPIRTGIGLFNVKLLAIDREGDQSVATVQVTPSQQRFLMLAEKESTSLRIKPHPIEKPPALH